MTTLFGTRVLRSYLVPRPIRQPSKPQAAFLTILAETVPQFSVFYVRDFFFRAAFDVREFFSCGFFSFHDFFRTAFVVREFFLVRFFHFCWQFFTFANFFSMQLFDVRGFIFVQFFLTYEIFSRVA